MIQEPEDDRPRRRRRTPAGAPSVGAPRTRAPETELAPASGPEPAPASDLAWGDPFAPYARQLDPPDAVASPPWTSDPADVMDLDPAPAATVPRPAPNAGRRAALVLAVLRPWLDPRPGELRGLIILLTAALTLSLALWFDATRRPYALPEGGATAPPSGVSPGDVSPSDVTPSGTRAGATNEGVPGVRADGSDGWGLAGAGEGARAADGPVVHVSGAVLAPGIVELPSGARVADAINAAGGAAPDAQLDRLNLARIVDDGEQVHVTRMGEDAPPPEATASRGVLPDGRIDLNTASAAELETLPGVGPARAQAIIAEREVRPFRVPGDLRRVPGIGEVTFQRLAPLVTVR
jgi:competence protein ComEA